MTNSADPDQLASEEPTDLDLHCLQRQGISGLGFKWQWLRDWCEVMVNPISGKLWQNISKSVSLFLRSILSLPFTVGPRHAKKCLRAYVDSEGQISIRIRAVWLGPSLPAYSHSAL